MWLLRSGLGQVGQDGCLEMASLGCACAESHTTGHGQSRSSQPPVAGQEDPKILSSMSVLYADRPYSTPEL